VVALVDLAREAFTPVAPAGSKSTCSSMSNIENTIWRSVQPALEVLRGEHLVEQRARQRAPVSTWAVIDDSTSHSQQKFSMNCDGSSTASHSTPLMPDTPARRPREHVVQAVAELVEQRDHFVVREARRLAADRREKLQVR
jgi:hypothetical protein